MAPLAIYVRVSTEEQGSGDSLEEQEASARAWAQRNGVAVYFDEAECSERVSAGLEANDRKLGRLIDRCEAGELGGIIVRYHTRFARDVIAGASAIRRLEECGARFVATDSGIDTQGRMTVDQRMTFNILQSVGQAERERNAGSFKGGKLKRAREGRWCGIAPFGYNRDPETKRLVPNRDADTVRDVFRLRARGEGFSEIARKLSLTRAHARKIVMNRVYAYGEQRVPHPDRRDEVITLGGQPPLVSLAEWETANAVQGRAPVHNGLSEQVELKGVVRCGECGGTMHVLAYGKDRSRRTYACTSGCGKTSMTVSKVEPAVLWQLSLALDAKEPHVAAVIEDDSRYTDALLDVECAERKLAEYRDSDAIAELGPAEYAAAIKALKERVELARRALRELPRPEKPPRGRKVTWEEFDAEDRRRFRRRCIAEVRVYPRANGDRLKMRWQGSDDLFTVPLALPAKPLPV